MRINDVSFYDIVETLSEDIELNIFELCYKLSCSEGVIYRRIVPEGYKGLIQLKDAIKEGKI